MNDAADDPISLYRETNAAGTLNLARQAAEAGVKRLVFVSTIKVNGEGKPTPYRESDVPAPEDAYAISKWEAEQGLHHIASERNLEVVILRPPLIYGPAVKANFFQLAQAVRRGWPLPLGAIENRRSLLYLGNMIDAIRQCLAHPAAAGKTYLLDDGLPISTPQLIRAMGQAMGRKARLLNVPLPFLRTAAGLIGRSAAIDRLAGSLFVDSSSIRSDLGWTPPSSMEAGLRATLGTA
jgi:UDP-glucose 4-epimerase